MVVLHLLSDVLIYLLSAYYVKSQRNRLWILFIFILLPGVVSSALIVNHAGVVIFGLLLYVYLDKKLSINYTNILLLIFALIDPGFAYLFLGLVVYSLFEKNKIFFVYNTLLYALNIYIYGFHIQGVPSGHFLDTMGVYSAIFTPIIFIYLVYVLYRKFLSDEIDKLWYISSTVLFISMMLSFRQRIEIEVFAPYLIIALPLAGETFASSYRVRLKEHRKKYRLIFIISVLFLLLNTLIVFFNKELYIFLENPKKHFAYNMHVAKELAKELKSQNIDCVSTNKKMQLRLKFYNIEKCEQFKLKELPLRSKQTTNVTIRYSNKIIYKAHVTKINNI
ncbi:hypothetical protein [Sulfurimonas sp.]|uniref:hypothetical protein n=1 Tax=Sulfurimonas sp. TaxID=2022749 RepID=UPI0026136476|nr:hypothetical protein [Sulfurimonas sp.]